MNKMNLTTPGDMELQAADGGVHAADHYARTPIEVLFNPALSMGARVCYTALMSFAISSNKVWPGQQRLAESLGVTTRMIRNYIDELRMHDLLTIKDRGGQKTNVYTLTVFVESKNFTVYDHNGIAVGDRKNTSAYDRKNISGQDGSDRKNISTNNDKDFPEYDKLNNKKKTQKPNLVEERFQKKISRGVQQDLAMMQRNKALDKLDAYCKAVGVNRAHLTGGPLERAIAALSESPMPVDEIPLLIDYLKTDAFFGLNLDRLTVKAVVDRWPLWVAAKRPWKVEPRKPSTAHQGRNERAQHVDQRMQAVNQKIADERNEVYEGVEPSYWRDDPGTVSAQYWSEPLNPTGLGLDFAPNNGNVGVRSHD